LLENTVINPNVTVELADDTDHLENIFRGLFSLEAGINCYSYKRLQIDLSEAEGDLDVPLDDIKVNRAPVLDSEKAMILVHNTGISNVEVTTATSWSSTPCQIVPPGGIMITWDHDPETDVNLEVTGTSGATSVDIFMAIWKVA